MKRQQPELPTQKLMKQMDEKLKYKISRILLILGITFIVFGLIMLFFDLSWVNTTMKVSNPIAIKRTVNGWVFLLIGAGMFYGRVQFKKNF